MPQSLDLITEITILIIIGFWINVFNICLVVRSFKRPIYLLRDGRLFFHELISLLLVNFWVVEPGCALTFSVIAVRSNIWRRMIEGRWIFNLQEVLPALSDLVTCNLLALPGQLFIRISVSLHLCTHLLFVKFYAGIYGGYWLSMLLLEHWFDLLCDILWWERVYGVFGRLIGNLVVVMAWTLVLHYF